MYCEDKNSQRNIPNYCYKDSSIWQYIGNNAYQFRDSQMKRALYIGDRVYGVSDKKIESYNWNLELQNTAQF